MGLTFLGRPWKTFLNLTRTLLDGRNRNDGTCEETRSSIAGRGPKPRAGRPRAHRRLGRPGAGISHRAVVRGEHIRVVAARREVVALGRAVGCGLEQDHRKAPAENEPHEPGSTARLGLNVARLDAPAVAERGPRLPRRTKNQLRPDDEIRMLTEARADGVTKGPERPTSPRAPKPTMGRSNADIGVGSGSLRDGRPDKPGGISSAEARP